ncbi:MAG: hypothetical protein IJK97_00715 [Thermoguttaceae bacterium]|nr:hypothetical protein [Thermoguttaceae bacterium]MBR0190430.1 hypothetical protein [Thermoguttaceae bacterium]
MTKISLLRLLHYIYTLQNRRSTGADWNTFQGYIDALKDNGIISPIQYCEVVKRANSCRLHLLTHCEPYEKIPYPEIKSELAKILNIETEETHEQKK